MSTFHVKQLPDRDWRTAWHEHFPLVRIPPLRGSQAPAIIIRPPHLSYAAKEREVVVDLAPALAFGTGQHQSTRLSLQLLAAALSERAVAQVLDVGTGSGILAAAAARLGAPHVDATDIDPLAVAAAQHAIRQNQLQAAVHVQQASIPAGRQYDLILANLTADLLQHLAPQLANALQSGGRLIASGLIQARANEVAAAFQQQGLALQASPTEDHWQAILLAKPAPP